MGWGAHTMLARIETAPLLHLQLESSKLRDDYLSSYCFEHSRIELALKDWLPWDPRLDVGQVRFGAMLAAARNITFSVGQNSNSQLSDRHVDAIKYITRKCPNLRSLLLVAIEHLGIFSHKDVPRLLSTTLNDRFHSVKQLQFDSEKDIALRRCAYGFKIGHPGFTGFSLALPNEGPLHKVYHIVYLYSFGGLEPSLSDLQDVCFRVPTKPYPKWYLRKLSGADRRNVVDRTKQLYQWQELEHLG